MARLVYCRRRRLIKLGFFRDLKSADDYIDTLENLHIDPGRYDLAWKIGVDADIMDETIRLCETQNFIKHLVVPYSLTK
ncbi:unnamed protein product [Albugo candida]|uniref:Uncharacterized protein n=1 Tax=Albugo candida TaxID=65357 RepID=A0A024GK04_9STRA|nr:unnamed protein product [Albugo candida]|eukprot:CCI47097.1 unnamed protein product [Albugo candida]